MYKSVPTIYFPVMWFSLEVEASDKFVRNLKSLLLVPDVFMYAGAFMVAVGSLIICTVGLLHLLNRQRANYAASDKVIYYRLPLIRLPYTRN